MDTNKGRLFLISAPSGCGKDTILSAFFKKHPECVFSISTITRPRRDASDDLKYNFISKEEFEKLIENDKLLEYAEYCGNYYGTPREPIEKWINEGKDVFVELETVGAAKIMQKIPDLISIFILPPSLKELRRRLSGRKTEDEEKIEARINEAVREMACAANYDYVLINDRLEDAVLLLESIVTADRAKVSRNKNIINEVLNNA